MEDPSVTVARAFEIVSKTASEWQRFRKSLGEEIINVQEYLIENTKHSDETWDADQENWVSTGVGIEFAIRERKKVRGRSPRIGAMCTILDLYRPGFPSSALGRALFQVGWAPKDNGWSIDELTLPVLGEEYELKGDRLFFWTGDQHQNVAPSMREKSWIYLVPLGAIGSRSDISRLLIEPVLTLVRGQAEAKAFAQAPEAIRFHEVEGEIIPIG